MKKANKNADCTDSSDFSFFQIVKHTGKRGFTTSLKHDLQKKYFDKKHKTNKKRPLHCFLTLFMTKKTNFWSVHTFLISTFILLFTLSSFHYHSIATAVMVTGDNLIQKEAGPTPLSIKVGETTLEVAIPQKYQDQGIKEVIAIGSSSFADSPASRMQNIRTAAKKLDGTLIPLGSTFSFNEILGSVSRKEGYVPDLVVRGNRNVWEMGGGVCQLSTSVFRAALNAGLPILAAKNHSIAIPFYKPYGLDAAIYMPYLDMKFVNNSPGDILMQVLLEGEELVVILYGTNDGRKTALKGPFINEKLQDPKQAYDTDPTDISEKKLDYRRFQVQWFRGVETAAGEKNEEIFTSWYRRGYF